MANLPTVWTNVAAGAVLSGAPLDPGTMVAVLVALSLFYTGGMYLNDAFDREVDARERPERPIPAGLVSARRVFIIGFGMLAVAVAILAVAAWTARWPGAGRAVASGAALAAAIVYYDVVHKRDPLSPLIMGLCRLLIYVTAALVVSGRIATPVLAGAAALLAYLIGVAYIATQENLARFRNAWPLVLLAVPFIYAMPLVMDTVGGALLYLGFLGWVVYSLSFLRPRRLNVPGAMVRLLAGICLLDALLMAGANEPRLAVAAIGAFVLTRMLQARAVL
ncbi:MAG TPA: UbiA family prenyltransferase [Candidatus Limnocylindria bacterium]|nr:UbiA family prenyltransferase [Candidatus Limnocylindria bacterium]